MSSLIISRLIITRNAAFWIYCTRRLCILQSDHSPSTWKKLGDVFFHLWLAAHLRAHPLVVALWGRFPHCLAERPSEAFSIHEPAAGVCEPDGSCEKPSSVCWKLDTPSLCLPSLKPNDLKQQGFSSVGRLLGWMVLCHVVQFTCVAVLACLWPESLRWQLLLQNLCVVYSIGQHKPCCQTQSGRELRGHRHWEMWLIQAITVKSTTTFLEPLWMLDSPGSIKNH